MPIETLGRVTPHSHGKLFACMVSEENGTLVRDQESRMSTN